MSQRPSLKLKFGSSAPKPEASPTPQSATTGTPKLKLKLGSISSTQAPQVTPNDPTSSFTSAGSKTAAKTPRKSKPTPKKRALENEDDINEDGEEPRSAPGPPIKKIKLKTRAPIAPIVKLNVKGKIPKRPRGVGYDSEADDRELDPTISEGFILRMQPGEDCDIIRKAAAEGNFGRKTGGADVRMRFKTSDGRRAAVSVNGRHYAAVLVDLPCVIEAMKTWDKKGPWMKSMDVCQMLVVMGQIKEEDDALLYPIPNGKGQLNERGELDEKTMQWASGITPPLHKVRKRRFRKRISVRDVMEVEAEVEALIARDEEAEGEPMVELIDENALRRQRDRENGESGSEEASDDDEDAEGDDYDDGYVQTTAQGPHDLDHDAMAEELEAALELEAAMAADHLPNPSSSSALPPLDDNNTPLTQGAPSTPASPSATTTTTNNNNNLPTTPSAAADTPGAATTTTSADDASDDDDEDDDDDDSDDGSDIDEDALERQQRRQQQKEEIADLEAAIRQEQTKAAAIGNALLKKKLLDKIRSLQADLDLKVAALGD